MEYLKSLHGKGGVSGLEEGHPGDDGTDISVHRGIDELSRKSNASRGSLSRWVLCPNRYSFKKGTSSFEALVKPRLCCYTTFRKKLAKGKVLDSFVQRSQCSLYSSVELTRLLSDGHWPESNL